MKISEITTFLQSLAPLYLQEKYDNAGLLTGSQEWTCTGIITSLDVTVEVVQEAIANGCNLVVSHHPIIFTGLKRINGRNYVERTIIEAIKHDIALYAIHTNIDNIKEGVNGKMAKMMGLVNRRILSPKAGVLRKLSVYVPTINAEIVRNAIFSAGAGHISNYSECSFNTEGTGTFKPGEGSNPFIGEPGVRKEEKEVKIEIIFPAWLQDQILREMKTVHPYEEVAYEIIDLRNLHDDTGSGMYGELPEPMDETTFLQLMKDRFHLSVVKHTKLSGKTIKKVAICGGAGSFLAEEAKLCGSDIYITSDVKYHEFFDANDEMIIADIGHYESEQFTIDLLYEILLQKFPTFAVQKTQVRTNPVHYYL